MSRIGKSVLKIPEAVTVLFENGVFQAKSSKSKLDLSIPKGFKVQFDSSELRVLADGDDTKPLDVKKRIPKRVAAMHGTLVRSIAMILQGVSQGFQKQLSLVGVGYKAELVESARVLKLSLGYSHDILHALPEGIEVVMEKPTLFKVMGSDKQKVGQVVASIMRYRPPEPYKGKGVQIPGQYIRRKEGKSK
jgi:large subunit ribosomal protein L6